MIFGGDDRILILFDQAFIKVPECWGGAPNYMRLLLFVLEAAQLRFFVVRALLKQHHLLCGYYAARHSQVL